MNIHDILGFFNSPALASGQLTTEDYIRFLTNPNVMGTLIFLTIVLSFFIVARL